MQVAKIKMSKEAAKEKLMAYRKALLRRGDAEYRAALEGYEALAAGTPVISLTQAIRGGGVDEQLRPRLAIARADRRQVEMRWRGGSEWLTFSTGAENFWNVRDSLLVRVNMGRISGAQRTTPDGYTPDLRGFALVPMIPADVRPRGQAKEWHILWEVEQWSDVRISARPDRDPYLLKHLGGDMYAVLAEWDLTEIERLVMAGRANQ